MQRTTQPFEFHGKTGEFFKIWIVNIMLSIITLGIYSAWAKVRTRRYFYGNTFLMNTPFDYLADPVKILKGRLLAFALILLYSFSALISPILEGVLVLIFIPLFPWIIIKSLQFNLYNSTYRNIRFHFAGDYLKALWVFIGLPVAVAFSLGLAYPYFAKERKKFVIDHSAYGTSQFSTAVTAGQFYGIYMKTAGVTLAVVLLGAGFNYALQLVLPMSNASEAAFILPALMALLFFPFLMIVYGYIYTTLTNLVINHTSLQQCRFRSNLETMKMCWLYFSNTVAIIFSLGLLIPWAMIRTARYRISCMTLMTVPDPEAFIAAEAEKADAIGEELGDLLDIDFGL
ncbi:YjgN family protein [Methylomarinum sp. Ch1-1]|uniref:YjgN family protein n=1 Tax=Methylomarinum roseum TaxID=3067653 RepID=A0AAU7NW25_9GAMM